MNQNTPTVEQDTIPTPAETVTQPTPRPRWSMKRKVATTLAAVVAAFIALGIIGSVTSPAAKTQATSTSAPAATPKATATQAQAPATPVQDPALTQAEKMTAWLDGEGGTNFQAVQADLGTMTTDATNQDLLSVEADGTALATDASAAASTPLPIDSADYAKGMRLYAMAGTDAAAGDITGATTAVEQGTVYINKVTAAMSGTTSTT